MWIPPIVVAAFIGFLLVRALTPLASRWAGLVLHLALGTGLGMGLTSTVFFLLLLCGAATPAGVMIADGILLVGAAVLFRRSRPAGKLLQAEPGFSWNWVLGAAFAAGLVLFLVSFADTSQAAPNGEWDAWSLWNLRAKFLASGGETWKYAVSPLLGRTHPDYPLMLSAFIARCWVYSGDTTPAVPIATALLFSLATIGVLVSGLAILRSFSMAWLAGLVLLSGLSYVAQGPAQYADVPLSFLLIGTLVLIAVSEKLPSGRGALALAGFSASLAAWTKNEGVVFLGLVLIVVVTQRWRTGRLRDAGILLSAAVPVALLTMWFKLLLAPSSDPLVHQALLGKLADPSRYAQVATAFAKELRELGALPGHPLILIALLAFVLRFSSGEPERRTARAFAAILGILLAAAFAAYVITPYDLAWHLGTSLVRLYAQVWPGALLALFLVLRRPEELAIGPSRGRKAAPPKSRPHL